MLKYRIMFKNIFLITAVGGFGIPVSPDVAFMSDRVLKTFAWLTVISHCPNILLMSYLIIFQWETLTNPTVSVFVLLIFVYTFVVTIYFYFTRHEFDQLLKRLDTATLMLYDNPLCRKREFSETLEKLKTKANKFSLYYVIFGVSMSVISIVSRYIGYWFRFSDEIELAYQFPFQITSSPLYDLVLFYQAVTGAVCYVKRAATDFFFAVLFIYLHLCHKHICNIFKDILGKHEIALGNVKRLQRWIRLHQQYQRYSMLARSAVSKVKESTG